MQAEPPSERPPTADWDPPRLPGPPAAAHDATKVPSGADRITRSSYGVSPERVWLRPAVVAAFAIIWTGSLLLGDDTSALALVVGIGIWLPAGWIIYSRLFRCAHLLELSDTELRWYAPLRRGAVSLNELREVRPGTPWHPWLMPLVDVVSFTTRSGRPFMAHVTARGFDAFVEDLRRAAPDARIDVGRGRVLFPSEDEGYRRSQP
jgi:hypothetical protein